MQDLKATSILIYLIAFSRHRCCVGGSFFVAPAARCWARQVGGAGASQVGSRGSERGTLHEHCTGEVLYTGARRVVLLLHTAQTLHRRYSCYRMYVHNTARAAHNKHCRGTLHANPQHCTNTAQEVHNTLHNGCYCTNTLYANATLRTLHMHNSERAAQKCSVCF